MNKRQLVVELEKMRPRYEEAVDLMIVRIQYLLRAGGLMHPDEVKHRVMGRVKSPNSFVKKVRRVERENRIRLRSATDLRREIDDIAGVRVVCSYLSDLALVYGQVKGHFREVPGKFEDYVQNDKFGYRALHTVVRMDTSFGPAKCEVQIRTALQDAWAVKSQALVYKLGKRDLAQLPLAVRNLLMHQSNMLYNLDQETLEIAELIRGYLRKRKMKKR